MSVPHETHWLRFVIELTPKVKKNSRPIFRNKKTGKVFLGKDKSLLEYERSAGLILASQWATSGLTTLSGRLEARFRFEFEKGCRADLDNLTTMVMDLLVSARIIEDDSLIEHTEAWIIKETGKPDRTIVDVRQIEPAAAILNAVSWDSMKKTWAEKKV